MKTYDVILPCSNGFTLCADGANLVVKRNKTTESYPIAGIQSFAIKKPGFLEGSITFTTAQASTGSINLVPAGSVVSVVDEIRGLKQLLDEGILTEEEFAAKKKQLLGI